MLRTDAMLADFLTFLDDKVGKGKYLVAVTGDHGIPPIPEDAAAPEVGAARPLQARHRRLLHLRHAHRPLRPARGALVVLSLRRPRRQLTSNGGVWVDGGIYLNTKQPPPCLCRARLPPPRRVEQLVCDAVNTAAIPGVWLLRQRSRSSKTAWPA